MSRLNLNNIGKAQKVVDDISKDVKRRIDSNPIGICPIDTSLAFLNLCHSQSCGKCVPCRVGLGQLSKLMESILDGTGTTETIDTIRELAIDIANTADCVIGREAAQMVLNGVENFYDDYESHVNNNRCIAEHHTAVPCMELCPAGVDIPGYITLIKEGRYADAVRLIRKDNPMPVTCAYICEHPCETRCRRQMTDASVNIRGLKRYAVDNAGEVENPPCAPSTGKTVAVIGGGPSGLTCAYYLALMGHKVTIYEKKKQLGGMLRYGIPSYRFPREKLDNEIKSMLSVGIDVKCEFDVGKDVFEKLTKEYDFVYISIGAHTNKHLGIPGEESKNVISAVEMLRGIGDGVMPDFTGKKVLVIGGGNVAMDVTRSSVRLGASKVTCVYRRRKEDMPAQVEEVEGAIAEGAEIMELSAPVRVEANENGEAVALWVQPQIIGNISGGRAGMKAADLPEQRIDADIIIGAIGQDIESQDFEACGLAVKRGAFVADNTGKISSFDNVYAGGDCVTGPATAVKAIAAGKVAAANIDNKLGYNHEITCDVEIPAPSLSSEPAHGRINTTEREAGERKCDFCDIECGMTEEGASKEASRCLRCDHYGYGIFKGGRVNKW